MFTGQWRPMGAGIAMVTLGMTYTASCFAQSADNAPTQLEEITITAQKRTEKLEDVSVAASVVNADSLVKANVGDISDLNNIVPSVNMNATINGRVPIGMRGISSVANEATVGLASGVAIMIDGVPVPSDSFSANQMEDVKSVEVLKGPQVTLGGRTASSGVINIVTRGPSDVFTGSASATATDDNEYRLNGFLAGPITDTLRYSLSAYDTSRQYPIVNKYYDKHTDQKNFGVRGKLQFLPTDDLDITLALDHQKSISHGFNFVYKYLTPGFYLITGTSGPSFMSQEELLPGITPGWDNQYYSSPVDDAGQVVTDDDGALTINYQMGDLTLGSTTSYQHEKGHQIQDLFAVNNYFFTLLTGGGLPFENRQRLNLDVSQFSEELKLVSPTDWDFSYVVGLFYSDSKAKLHHERGLVPALTNYTVTPVTKTYDVYGRSTWKFRPNTWLVTGLRYNIDKLSYTMDQVDYQVLPFPTYPSAGAYKFTTSSDSSAVVGDISLQQHFNDDSMVYVSYVRGYAPEVYNTSLGIDTSLDDPTSVVGKPVGQMHINHFELGSKGTYMDGRVRVNASLFDTIYSDYQIQSYSAIVGAISPPLILSSVGKAETRGLEVDMDFAATNSLTINTSLAFIDAKFKDYSNAPCWGGTGDNFDTDNNTQQTAAGGCELDADTGQYVQDVSGKTMPNSPKFKGTIGAEQVWPIGNYELNLGGTYAYRTKAQMLPDQNPEAVQDAFGLLNMHLGLQTADGNYSATVFGNNLTNHHYAGDVEDFWTGPWGSNAVIMQPARDSYRYFGIRLNAKF